MLIQRTDICEESLRRGRTCSACNSLAKHNDLSVYHRNRLSILQSPTIHVGAVSRSTILKVDLLYHSLSTPSFSPAGLLTHLQAMGRCELCMIPRENRILEPGIIWSSNEVFFEVLRSSADADGRSLRVDCESPVILLFVVSKRCHRNLDYTLKC